MLVQELEISLVATANTEWFLIFGFGSCFAELVSILLNPMHVGLA